LADSAGYEERDLGANRRRRTARVAAEILIAGDAAATQVGWPRSDRDRIAHSHRQHMHPSFSIIAFTTAAGAGFALLFLIGVGAPLGLLPASAWFGFAALATAFVPAAGGLVASAFHLGRPERAWRAFSQWRSSWLSREGVLSVATFIPAAIFAVGWLIFGAVAGGFGFCGFLAAMLAAGTVYCTGMIYASLKPIRQWHNRWTVPNYLLLALMSGFLLLDLVVRFWLARPLGTPILAFVAIVAAWAAKEAYWRSIDTSSAPSTVASATALGRGGRVRLLEPPHTQDNYLLQEMGYRIARKHRTRLRAVARVALFALPAALTLVALFAAARLTGEVAAAAAAASAALGLVVERWLFFAEAQHTVMLYYGAEAV
jgi:sulfite dehydrogenase (quinone) subunit SoeC